jgi:hypothetical protein
MHDSIFYDDVFLENPHAIGIFGTIGDSDSDLFTVGCLEESPVNKKWAVSYGSLHYLGIK